ncbi:FeoA family protein [Streptomyces sp. 21So2-11]|uniref:FeoA family protein n=1 Tax=Streptomyces sp. 21So2-11 TaxID=3144408 RepID=UPI00321BA90F
MVLGECPAGSHVVLRGVETHRRDRLRMAELGFVVGARLHVISRDVTGRIVVAVNETRLGLDGATGSALVVEAEPKW